MQKSKIIVSIVAVFFAESFSQDSILVDVFPLEIGNTWTYDYNYFYSYSHMVSYVYLTREGTVNYEIIDKQNINETVIWRVKTSWDIYSHSWSSEFGDTSYTEIGSSFAELNEQESNNHHLYLTNDDSSYKVWRLPNEFWDSVKVHRYQMVGADSVSIIVGKIWTNVAQPCTLKFKEETGILEVFIDYTMSYFPAQVTLSCQLINSSITSVKQTLNDRLSEYLLISNYPNPFNPGTTIRYNLLKDGHTQLIVYDILGEEIKILVDEFKKAGTYEIAFNANNYSTGIYICKLNTSLGSVSRKILFTK